MDQLPIKDVRFVQTGRTEESAVNQKVERKPEGPPRGQREFKEVSEEVGEKKLKKASRKTSTDDTEKPRSIFDLSRQSALQTDDDDNSDVDSSVPQDVGVALEGMIKDKPKPTTEKLPRNAFDTDQPDLAEVDSSAPKDTPRPTTPPAATVSHAENASATAAAAIAANPSTHTPPVQIGPVTTTTTPRVETPHITQSDRILRIKEIIDQIADNIYTLETRGQVDTTVKIKNIPLFEGASITLHAYKNVSKQYNISFTNLTQQAKDFLDSKQNLDGLQQILDSRGVTVHIVMTTTQAETPIMIRGKEEAQREDRGGKGNPDRQDRRQG